MHVGEIIHKLRKSKKMTLLELSTGSGVALATLSRMENGKMTGTLESHMKICKALETALPDLYMDLSVSKKTIEMRPKSDKVAVNVHNKKATVEILASNIANKKMLPLSISIARSGCTSAESGKVGMEKFIYILDGKIEALIGDTKYSLKRGDTLYFDASLTHLFRNTGNGEAYLISVVCPPNL